jgi:hypothetical protein
MTLSDFQFKLCLLIPNMIEDLQRSTWSDIPDFFRSETLISIRDGIYTATALTAIAALALFFLNAPAIVTVGVTLLGTAFTCRLGYQFYIVADIFARRPAQ